MRYSVWSNQVKRHMMYLGYNTHFLDWWEEHKPELWKAKRKSTGADTMKGAQLLHEWHQTQGDPLVKKAEATL